MSPHLLIELTNLFSLEAFEADKLGNHHEADRLWEIADQIHGRVEAARCEFVERCVEA